MNTWLLFSKKEIQHTLLDKASNIMQKQHQLSKIPFHFLREDSFVICENSKIVMQKVHKKVHQQRIPWSRQQETERNDHGRVNEIGHIKGNLLNMHELSRFRQHPKEWQLNPHEDLLWSSRNIITFPSYWTTYFWYMRSTNYKSHESKSKVRNQYKEKLPSPKSLIVSFPHRNLRE